MKSIKSILNRDFKYVPASRTNIAKTFARERARLAANNKEQEDKVRQIATIMKVKK